jgi:subtilisin family serine protease
MSSESWISLEQARLALIEGDGSGVRIAVLDSGIDTSHPGLADLTLADDIAIVPKGGRLNVEQGHGIDVFGHGTAIAGILHQEAPAAAIGSIRVLGHFKESRANVIREGVKQAARLGYHILQCSFGAPPRSDDALIYKGWLDAVYLRGIHVVAAGANSSFQTPEWPAHFTSVIGVGTDALNRKSLERQRGSLIELAIGGQEKQALWPGGKTREVMGSSYAAPRATALLARLLSVYPKLSPTAAKSLLIEIAEE